MNDMKDSVLVIGAANFDIKGRMFERPVMESSNGSAIRTSFGGVARNVAENLARLGAPVTLLTAVGDDYPGADMLNQASEAGIDVSRTLIAEHETTGTYLAALDPTGDLYLGLDDLRVLRHITPTYLRKHIDAFRECALIAIDLNLSDDSLREVLTLARQFGKRVCVDPTSTTLAHRLRPILQDVQIITPNIAEAEEILQCAPIRNADEALGAARALVTKGVQVAVITQAERGACYAIESESAQFPALRVSIADTTGAGDSLTAMVIYGIVNGWEMGETLQMGLRLAAHTLRTAETVAQDLSLDLLYDVK